MASIFLCPKITHSNSTPLNILQNMDNSFCLLVSCPKRHLVLRMFSKISHKIVDVLRKLIAEPVMASELLLCPKNTFYCFFSKYSPKSQRAWYMASVSFSSVRKSIWYCGCSPKMQRQGHMASVSFSSVQQTQLRKCRCSRKVRQGTLKASIFLLCPKDLCTSIMARPDLDIRNRIATSFWIESLCKVQLCLLFLFVSKHHRCHAHENRKIPQVPRNRTTDVVRDMSVSARWFKASVVEFHVWSSGSKMR